MLFLIDGYNLLHALGLPKQLAPSGLHHARLRLLDLVRGAFGDDATSVTIVFDASRTPPGATEVQNYRGIEVRFAVHEKEADDLIELLIQRNVAPRQLTVVSDDHRLQKAARRRQCAFLGCNAFFDWMDRRRSERSRPLPAPEPTKPQASTPADLEHWLRAFGDLDGSPDMREAFNPFDFEDEGEGK